MWQITNLWHEPLVVDEVVPDWRGERMTSLAHHTLLPGTRVFMQKPGPLTFHLKQRGRVDGIEVDEAEYRALLGKEKQAAELRSVRLMKAKVASGALKAEVLPEEYRPTSAKAELPKVESQAEAGPLSRRRFKNPEQG
jgi:hypothetical protein